VRARIENHLPDSLPVGRPTTLFIYGHCFDAEHALEVRGLIVDGFRHPPAAQGMPRADLAHWLARTGEDRSGASLRSGFWGLLPIPAQPGARTLAIALAVRLADGRERIEPLAELEIVEPPPFPATPAADAGTIAICLASYEPNLELFAIQIESLRAQSDERWVCVVSDDRSSPHTLAAMAAVLGSDPRFTLTTSARRRGPYRNFERALELAPAAADLIALCDQDDRWHADKLATLRAAIGDAALAFSDLRLTDPGGAVLGDTLWTGRRNDHANLASLLVANAVPGASMLLRRDVAERALPFPDAPGQPFHDHWLALVALASGEISYVDRPLYDYVQHRAGVVSHLPSTRRHRRWRWPRSRAQASRRLRSAYFACYMTRAAFAQTLLERCADTLTPRKRRALRWYLGSPSSPAAFAWLAARPLRRLLGHDETLGGEFALLRGIAWLKLIAPRSDASFPDPPEFDQPRLRRWRAGA